MILQRSSEAELSRGETITLVVGVFLRRGLNSLDRYRRLRTIQLVLFAVLRLCIRSFIEL